MRVDADGYSFNFKGALAAFVFDEEDKSKPTFHGQPMKAVDVIAEFNNAYIYVEVKEFHDLQRYDPESTNSDEGVEGEEVVGNGFNWLKNYLKYKYRDSYLFRHAEDKVEKPIIYICLLNLSNDLNGRMQKALSIELPVGKTSPRWEKEIAKSCQVVNLRQWNRQFPKWPVTRLSKQ